MLNIYTVCMLRKQCMYVCMVSGGTNLHRLLVDNGINMYGSITKWTNCSGKQRCGTCIVDVSTPNLKCMYVCMYVCMHVIVTANREFTLYACKYVYYA